MFEEEEEEEESYEISVIPNLYKLVTPIDRQFLLCMAAAIFIIST